MMRRAKPMAYAPPLGSMILLVLIVGWAAVKIVPRWLEKHSLPRVPQHHRPNAELLCLFSAAIILIPVCKYSGSSRVIGSLFSWSVLL